MLRPLKRAGFMVEVISQEPQGCVFFNNPFIDKLSIKRKEDFPTDMLAWQEWFAGRAREYTVFANLSHSMESTIALFPASTPFWWPEHFRRKWCNHNYLEMVHDIFAMPYEFGPLFFPTDSEKELAQEVKARMGERVVGFCLSGTRLDKMYPYAPMLIGRIIKELGLPVMMFGAPTEKDRTSAQAIEAHVGRQNGTTEGLHLALSPENGRPTWPIRRVLAQAAACDVVVGPDTGPSWSVAFEPIPKVVMLSHASPENITKHWTQTITLHADPKCVPSWPCHRLHDSPATCVPNKDNNGAACMSDISVELVLQAVQAALGDADMRGKLQTDWASRVIVQKFDD